MSRRSAPTLAMRAALVGMLACGGSPTPAAPSEAPPRALSTSAATASPTTASSETFPTDPEAVAIAEKLRAKYAPLATYDAEFTQLGGGPGAGHVEVMRPDRFRWDYRRPAGDLVVSDLRTTWRYDAAANEAHRFRDLPDPWSAALAFVLGDCDLAAQFMLVLELRRPAGMLAVKARPKTWSRHVASVTFFIDPATYDVRAAMVETRKSPSLTIAYSSPFANSPIPASLFTGSPPPGAKLVP